MKTLTRISTIRCAIMALTLVVTLLSIGCRSNKNNWQSGERKYNLGDFSDKQGTFQYTLICKPKTAMLISKGKKKTRVEPVLGIKIEEIDKNLAKRKDLIPFQGILITEVNADGPADQAGVLPGDIILKVNETPVIYGDQIKRLVSKTKGANPKFSLEILRSKKEKLKLIVTSKMKDVYERSSQKIDLTSSSLKLPLNTGISLSTLPQKYAKQIFGSNSSGAVITGIAVGSPAYIAGLRSGDFVISINSKNFNSAKEIEQWFKTLGSKTENLEFKVDNVNSQLGDYTAKVPAKEMSEKTYFLIPLLFNLENSPDLTQNYLGLAPSPLTSIYEYKGQYLANRERSVKYRRKFDFIGFEYGWTEQSCHFSFLWMKIYKSQRL